MIQNRDLRIGALHDDGSLTNLMALASVTVFAVIFIG